MPRRKPKGKTTHAGEHVRKPRTRKLKHATQSTQLALGDADEGNKDTLFFYGHKAPPYDFLSQHFLCDFTAPSPSEGQPYMIFRSTEQYMMFHKAILFGDLATSEPIMQTADPIEQKRLGRIVSGFADGIWNANRERIVEDGNWNKFTNSTDSLLKKRLLNTGERELVEAARRDRIWGIGFGETNAMANRPKMGVEPTRKGFNEGERQVEGSGANR